MKKYLTPALAVIAVIAIVLCFVFNGQKGSLQSTADSVKAELEALKTESEAKLADAEAAKTAVTEELEALKAETETKLADAEAAKAAVTEELEALKAEKETKLAEAETAKAAATEELEALKAESEAKIAEAEAKVADLTKQLEDAAAAAAATAEDTAKKAEEAAGEVANAAAETVEEAKEAVTEAAGEIAVMSHADFVAAANDTEVVVESYVQAHQAWWDNKVTVYLQDKDGAYFVYELACSGEDAAKLVPGQKIRVKGFKGEWAGEVEIMDGTFEFVEADPWIAEAEDVTALLAREELADHMNEFVAVKGATVVAQADGAAFNYKKPEEKTDDLCFAVDVDGQIYNFCVEFYLTDRDTDVYKAVEALNVGDVVDLEGFLYWYNGPNLQTTGLTFSVAGPAVKQAVKPAVEPAAEPVAEPAKKSGSSTSFTNKYGTRTTKCAHPGCNNYIASSGDTNCCPVHSRTCAGCGKYIDEDAFYCMDCIQQALGK